MDYKDYYKILDVPKGATAEEIRSAYRKGARKYHPDINQSPGAETRFKEINEANEVLKDPEKRKRYDLYGDSWVNGETDQNYSNYSSTGNNWQEDGETFSDFFRTVFETNFSESGSPNYKNSTDDYYRQPAYEAEITLSLQELMNSEMKTISFQTRTINTQGNIETREKTLNVRIPRGVTDGSTIRLPGIEKDEVNGAGASDLLLKVRIHGNSAFEIKGYNLETKVPVTPWEAALGANIAVETVDGYVTLTVPPATVAGKRFRLRAKGLPKKNNGSGDIIVEIVIQIPESLSDEERRLFEELSSKSQFDPRTQRECSSV